MSSITPSLWFDGKAEEAAAFYAAIFPDSRIDCVLRAPADNPSTAKGEVLVVEFTLKGQRFSGINGGPQFPFTPAVSLRIECESQAELDRYWQALTADGGAAGRCGWCEDRFGLSWQVIPRRLDELLASDDGEAAERVMRAMLGMGRIDIGALEAAAAGAEPATS
ncbi:VOC family protein [Geminicoccaceae bacterium 1502E]|nr:VOC family protein [Geminicoccaceae bacterium 1502E]